MKIFLTFFFATIAVLPAASQNPISPPVCILPTHQPTSGMTESFRYYCSVRHHVLVTGDWTSQTVKIPHQPGVHSLWLQFNKDEGDLLTFDWMEFRQVLSGKDNQYRIRRLRIPTPPETSLC